MAGRGCECPWVRMSPGVGLAADTSSFISHPRALAPAVQPARCPKAKGSAGFQQAGDPQPGAAGMSRRARRAATIHAIGQLLLGRLTPHASLAAPLNASTLP